MYFAGTDAQLLDSKDFAIQDYISMNSPIEMHGHHARIFVSSDLEEAN